MRWPRPSASTTCCSTGLLIKQTEHLSLFAAPALLDRDYEADASAYESVIDQVRKSTPCVMLDLPHVWRPWVQADAVRRRRNRHRRDARSRRAAERQEPARPGARPASQRRAAAAGAEPDGRAERPEIPAKEFGEALGVEPALIVPFDPQLFGTAANNGQMLAEVQPAREGRPRRRASLPNSSPAARCSRVARRAAFPS